MMPITILAISSDADKDLMSNLPDSEEIHQFTLSTPILKANLMAYTTLRGCSRSLIIGLQVL
jgi:hypothetical protein